MSKTYPKAGDITPAQIQQWKKEYVSVFGYTAKDGKKAYFKKPNFQDLSFAATGADDMIKYNERLANTCFIGGDREIIDKQDYMLGLHDKLDSIIKVVEGEMEEL